MTNLFFQWRPPSDLLEIAGYRVYQDDVLVAELAATTLTYAVSGLETGRLYRFRIEAGNEDANWTTNGLELAVRPAPGDPTSMASVPGNGIPTSAGDSVRFLFDATNAVQTGADTNALDSYRLAVLRGRALDAGSNVLEGVAVSILGAPDYGVTLSRTNGCYDMAVNGGSTLVLEFNRYGFLPLQRTLDVPWQETVDVPDVFLLQSDTNSSVVELTNGPAVQVALGPMVSDEGGTRRAMVLMPTNARASIITYAGVTQEVDQLTTRFTEYTEGATGPGAMPGDMPASVAYTYCVELGSREAQDKVEGRDVLFNTNVYFYLDNFLQMPPGIAVPMGYYDNQGGAWVPSPNGRVINLLGTNEQGLALVCANTNGVESDAAELESLGFTDDERRTLAQTYPLATNSLWRVPIRHFSTYDCNYGVVLDEGAVEPQVPGASGGEIVPEPNVDCGNSGIEMENQTLTETLRVSGTPFYLVYSSQMAAQNPSLRSLRIPVSGAYLPTNLTSIRVKMSVAGKQHTYVLPPQTNQFLDFKWDGLDGYGRAVKGAQPVSYSIEYLYPGFYAMPPEMSASFGAASGVPVPGMIRSREPVALRQTHRSSVGTLDAASRGLGGWMLSVHHVYDPVNKTLYLGSGRMRTGVQLMTRSSETEWIMDIYAGSGEWGGFSGDGGPARKASLNSPKGLCVGPDGSVYVADDYNNRVRKITPDGIISTFAGCSPAPSTLGDGGPATSARLLSPKLVAMGPDNSLYIVSDSRVRRVTWGGMISTVVGNGIAEGAPQIPGVSATNLPIDPAGIAVSRDGTLFLSSSRTNLVWRIGPDGIAQIIAGFPDAHGAYDGENLPARQSRLSYPIGLALTRTEQLLICVWANKLLRLVTTAGFLQTFAGNGMDDSEGDGGDALLAGLSGPFSVAVGRDGSVFVVQKWWTSPGCRLRQILPDGRIITIIGDGTEKVGYGTLARQVGLSMETYIASAPDGSLYMSDSIRHRIYRLRPATRPIEQSDTLLVASEDAAELYVFDLNGRHLRTLDVLTGATNLTFSYTTNGWLDAVTDVNGRLTRIHRDGSGNPTSIEAPGGQTVAFTLDGEGLLHTATYPDSAQYRMDYTNTLLAAVTHPGSNVSRYVYDDSGNLASYVRVSGGTGTLARIPSSSSGWTVVHTNPVGVAQTFETELTGEGGMWSRARFACGCGSDSDTYIGPDGLSSNVTTDFDVTLRRTGPDPRFGMQSPNVAWSSYRTPGGREVSVSNSFSAVIPDASVPQNFTFLTNRMTVNGRTNSASFNRAQREFTEKSPMNRVTVTRLDAKGRVIYSKRADLAEASFDYDANGYLSVVTVGSGPEARITALVNDDRGNVIQATDPESVATHFQYSEGDWLTNTLRAVVVNTARSRDLEGNILSIRSSGGKAHTFAYTPANLLTRYYTPAVGGVSNLTQWTYDADDRAIATSYADGSGEEFGYDSVGRMAWHGYEGEGENYTYSGGQLTRVESSNGVAIDLAYDGSLLLAEAWTGPVTGSVARAYDNNLWVTNLLLNGVSMAGLGYDLDGLLIQAGEMTLTRDAQNGLVTRTQLGVVEDFYSYNNFGEVTGYVVQVQGTNLYTAAYERDKLGRITRQIASDNSTVLTNEYTYDAAGRYLQVVTNGVALRWQFDPDGNLTNFSRSGTAVTDAEYDGQDRLTRWGSDAYTFTARGTLSTAMLAGVANRFVYNVPGDLVDIARDAGPVTNVSYLVDGKGRRVARYVNGVRTHGYLYYDDLRPAATLDAVNGQASCFVYGFGAGSPSYMIVTGRAYRMISDHIGSPIFVVDSVTGEIVQRMSYDLWGSVQDDTHPLFQPFGFVGGLHDPETGFVRFGGRDYDPATARWTARDPMLFSDEVNNPYAYCQNDPVNRLDLEGALSKKWVLVIRISGTVSTTVGGQERQEEVWQARSIDSETGDSIYVGPHSKARIKTADNSVFDVQTGDKGKVIPSSFFVDQVDWAEVERAKWNKILEGLRNGLRDPTKKAPPKQPIPNCVIAPRG